MDAQRSLPVWNPLRGRDLGVARMDAAKSMRSTAIHRTELLNRLFYCPVRCREWVDHEPHDRHVEVVGELDQLRHLALPNPNDSLVHP